MPHLIRIALFCFLLPGGVRASAFDWAARPEGLGSVLSDGTWAVVRTLGSITATPEFSFPVQLVYHNANSRVGLWGAGWSCPQLESSVLPGQARTLTWRAPSGRLIGLHAIKGSNSDYTAGMDWSAKRSGSRVEIRHREGWIYRYQNGRLDEVESPTRRILTFQYRQSLLSQVILRDGLSDASLTVIDLKLQRGRVVSVGFDGGQHGFSYHDKQPALLAEHWPPGFTRSERYDYDDTQNTLRKISLANGETQILKCSREASGDAAFPAHRLLDDGFYQYSYQKKEGGSLEIEAKDPAGATMTYCLQSKRGILTQGDPSGKTVTYYYRAPGKRYNGKVRRVERNGNIVADHTYDAKTERLIESRDATGQITFYEYPSLRNLKPGDPLYDKPARILQGSRKTREILASFAYDSSGRLSQKTDAAGQVVALKYSSRGDAESATGPDGKVIEVQTDPLGHVLSMGEGAKRQKTSYDKSTGKVKFRQLPDGQYVDYVYDDCGRVKEIMQKRMMVASFEYDEMGRVVARKDGLGRETRLVYDTKSNLLEEHQPNGAVTRYEYDERNLRTAQIDANGNRVSFLYDMARKLVEQKGPLGQKLTWVYDDKGRLTERTNGAQIIKYGHDDKDRLRVINYGRPGEKLVQTYDEKGRLIRVATPTIVVNMTYDTLNRIIARQMIRGQTERVVRLAYSPSGKKASVVLSEKDHAGSYKLLHQNEYSYDANGHLRELKANGRVVSQYAYDSIGRLVRREYGNGISAAYLYDSFGRLSRAELSGGPLERPLLLAYDWDVAGQVTRRVWNNEAQSFTYDGSGQLLAVLAQSAETPAQESGVRPVSLESRNSTGETAKLLESYKYDPAGNIVEKFEHGLTTTMTYDTANQLTAATRAHSPEGFSAETFSYTYDAAGRQNRIQGPEGLTERSYGWLDKVITLKKTDGSQIAFDYYPDGQIAVKGVLASAEPGKIEPASEGTPEKSSFDYLRTLIGARSAVTAELDDSLETSPMQKALQSTEEFVWDDLALLWKDGTGFAVEPHPSGGSCVAAFARPDAEPIYFINDILGTTLAAVSADRVEIVPLTAFGKPLKRPTDAPLREESSTVKTKPFSQGPDARGN